MVKALSLIRCRSIFIIPCAGSFILFIAFTHSSGSKVVRRSLWLKRSMVQYALNQNVRADKSTSSQSVSSKYHAYGSLEIFAGSYSVSRAIDSFERPYLIGYQQSNIVYFRRYLAFSSFGIASRVIIALNASSIQQRKTIACPGRGGVALL